MVKAHRVHGLYSALPAAWADGPRAVECIAHAREAPRRASAEGRGNSATAALPGVPGATGLWPYGRSAPLLCGRCPSRGRGPSGCAEPYARCPAGIPGSCAEIAYRYVSAGTACVVPSKFVPT